MPIYIRGEDEETLARLKELGLDAQIASEDPMADLIFYVARMNAKLDNLGQLRHLHKMMQSTTRIRTAAEEEQRYYERLNREYDMKQARLKMIYNRMKDLTDLPENTVWRTRVPTFSEACPQSEADVFRIFQCEVDQNYVLYALAEGAVFIKGLNGASTVLPTKFERGGAQIRLIDL